MSLRMMFVYTGQTEDAFRAAWATTGKKLERGKSCVRFRKVGDLALDVIAGWIRDATVDKFVATYESGRMR